MNRRSNRRGLAIIKTITVLTAILVIAWATPAFANECPMDMQEIDAALSKGTKGTKLSADDLAKIKKWRAKGEELHKAGKHKEAMKILDKAKDMLGI